MPNCRHIGCDQVLHSGAWDNICISHQYPDWDTNQRFRPHCRVCGNRRHVSIRNQYCYNCAANNNYCVSCNSFSGILFRVLNSDLQTISVCSSCKDNNPLACNSCNRNLQEDFDLQNTRRVNGVIHCSSCAQECLGCYSTFLRSDINSQGVCNNCMRPCSNCNTATSIINSYSISVVTEQFPRGEVKIACKECLEECENCRQYKIRNTICFCQNGTIIHRYNYLPKLTFFKSQKDKGPGRYFGIELEVEGPNHDCNVEQIVIDTGLNKRPELFVKHDGSLNYGFEIVTHPATYRFWSEYDWAWAKQLVNLGCRSYETTTCGMHVHVSRDSFVNPQTVNRLFLFFRNNPDFIAYLSRRTKKNLRQWAAVPNHDCNRLNLYNWVSRRTSSQADIYHYGNDREPKYQALNLLHRDTIEIRIFRGTLSVPAIKRNIAVCQALIDFVHQASLNNLTVEAFKAYVKTPELIHWVSAFTAEN